MRRRRPLLSKPVFYFSGTPFTPTLSMPTAWEPCPGNRKAMGVAGTRGLAGAVGAAASAASAASLAFRRSARAALRSATSRRRFSSSAHWQTAWHEVDALLPPA